jgi:hypothetical protein
VQAVFHEVERIVVDDDLAGSLAIEPDAPCLVMLRRAEGGIVLSVADPTQMLEVLSVCLSGHYEGDGCVYDPVEASTTVSVHLPTAGEAGGTAQVMLQPRKQPSAGPKPVTLP